MITKSGSGRRPSWTPLVGLALLAVLVTGLELGGEPLRQALRLDSAAVAGGQYWRLATGHLVHLGWRHVALNLAGVLLVGLLFAGRYRTWQWAVVAAGSILVIDAGLLLIEGVGWYVGLSGVLHGAFAAGVLAALLDGERDAWWLAALLVAKLVWEQVFGPLPLTERSAGGPVLVDSHFYGALGGLAAALPILLRRRQGPSANYRSL